MGQVMDTLAVVLEGPERLALARLSLCEVAPEDVVVDIEWSGISTGTERLLWSGRMPPFPGMGYPLVPGYESVGRISALGAAVAGTRRLGERVFVPGARCYGEVRGLFGGAASRVVVPAARVTTIDESLGESAVLLALAATARHALAAPGARPPELIVGHGVLGRLLARVALAEGAFAPTVWERDAARARSDGLYTVVAPDDDPRRDYRAVYDVSGDAAILDGLLDRLAPGGEITLAGFYPGALSFDFPKAFMREARFRIAAEWKDSDMKAVLAHIDAGRLSLDGLVTHRQDAAEAAQAYRRAFEDTACLKMILDWRHAA
jgi:3-hydroxyethyl bacteriochlorophyllide a dehydrogenase